MNRIFALFLLAVVALAPGAFAQSAGNVSRKKSLLQCSAESPIIAACCAISLPPQ